MPFADEAEGAEAEGLGRGVNDLRQVVGEATDEVGGLGQRDPGRALLH